MLGQMPRTLNDDKLHRMVDAGYPQGAIATALGIDIQAARQLVHAIKKAKPQKRRRTRDVALRDIPIGGSGEPYFCTTGADDRYLAALKRHHPERT